MTNNDEFHDDVHTMHQAGRIYLEGDYVTFSEGDAQRIVSMLVDDGDENLTVLLDAYHLRQLRLALQRAEKWVTR